MAWRIEFTGSARKQLKKLDKDEARLVLSFLRQRVAPLEDPRQLGKPLKGQLVELWRYRAGDYRIVCDIRDEEILVLVVRVGHRKDVYRK